MVKKRASTFCVKALMKYYILCFYLLMPSWTATATATVAPTIGLLPILKTRPVLMFFVPNRYLLLVFYAHLPDYLVLIVPEITYCYFLFPGVRHQKDTSGFRVYSLSIPRFSCCKYITFQRRVSSDCIRRKINQNSTSRMKGYKVKFPYRAAIFLRDFLWFFVPYYLGSA